MYRIFILFFISFLNAPKYLIFISSITSKDEKMIERINIYFRIPNKPEKKSFSLLNVGSGTRYPLFMQNLGEIHANHITVVI